MNKYIFLPNFPHFTIIQLIALMLLAGLTRFALAAELRIEPAAPIIAVGESIPLTVSGAEGKIMWRLPQQKGDIQVHSHNRATYVAPNEVGQYYVQVLNINSSNKPISTIQITVLPKEAAERAFSREKSVWEIFTNRSNITALTLSHDGKTLWVGTQGGLEKRDADTGRLIKLFTNLDGLPDNFITVIENDGNGGLWIGTSFGGIAHFNSRGEWKIFNTENGLPDNVVNAIVNDGNGGVWIATGHPMNEKGLYQTLDKMTQNGEGDLIDALIENPNLNELSNLLSNGLSGNSNQSPFDFGDSRRKKVFDSISSGGLFNFLGISNNGNGPSNCFSMNNTTLFGAFSGDKSRLVDILGCISMDLASSLGCSKDNPLTMLYSGSKGGLIHLKNNGELEIFDPENLILPDNIIADLVSDGKGGLWVGTYCGGLVHLSSNGKETIYNTTTRPNWPGNFINALARDDNGLWVGIAFKGLLYLNNSGEWRIFNTKNTDLPYNNIISKPLVDNTGVWVGTGNILGGGGLVHLNRSNQKVERYTSANSNLPGDIVSVVMNDGSGGLWVGTQAAGMQAGMQNVNLAHFSNDDEWLPVPDISNLPSSVNPELSDNFVNVVIPDGEGGVWLGMGVYLLEGGLAHLNSKNELQIFNTNNSGLPNNNVFALAKDGNEGLWVGTHGGGLAYLSSDEKWQVFNNLPGEYINILEKDGNNGLWIGTSGDGLIHRRSNGEWKIYTSANSSMPHDSIMALLDDGNEGVWMGTTFGLAHLNHKKKWAVYTTKNSGLPHNLVTALMNDGKGGLWIGTGTKDNGGLAHLSKNGKWNLELPNAEIRTLAEDGSGGLWIGTEFQGLIHRSLRGDMTIFNMANSSLPNNRIRALANDGSNGLWVAKWGVAHLTFSQKPFLCEKVPGITGEQCANLLKGSRTAIVIHPNGRGSGYEQDMAVDNMATHIYQTLFLRGYDHDEIYYLAYKPDLDFNGDDIPDFEVVDAPITLQESSRDKKPREPLTIKHLEQAFEWAKNRHEAKAEGVPEEPLLVIFVDHGLPDKLVLSPGNNLLEELKFKALLDNYQATTGNKVVVILEACHSGTLVVPPLLQETPNRLIITSTDDKRAYYKDSGRTSFSKFYFDDLHRGTDYWNSWRFVKDDIFAQLDSPFNQQHPQLKVKQGTDGKIAEFCLNQCYGSLPEPELMPETLPDLVFAKGSIELAVKIKDNDNEILSVSVSVISPKKANEYNAQGFELNKSFVIDLIEGNNGRWFTRFNDFTKPGKYNFIFRAVYKVRSGKRTVSALKPVTVSFFKP